MAIVLGHVLRGLVAAGAIDSAGSFVMWDKLLYSFHVAVFAFLAGLFVRGSVERAGVGPYLRRRLANFTYLFILWSLLQGAAKLLTGALVNTPTSITDVLRFWEPEGQLWFLPFLMVATASAALARPWRRRWIATLSVAVALIVAVVSWGIEARVIGLQGLPLLLFYLVGVLTGAPRLIRVLGRPGILASGLAAAAFGSCFVVLVLFTSSAPPTVEVSQRTARSIAWGLLATTCGVVVTLVFSRVLSLLGGTVRLLAFIGQRTLEIFLAHILAAAGTRILLTQLGISNVYVHVALGIVAGVGLPIALWWFGLRLRVPYLFEPPSALTGRNLSRSSATV